MCKREVTEAPLTHLMDRLMRLMPSRAKAVPSSATEIAATVSGRARLPPQGDISAVLEASATASGDIADG